MSTLISNVLEGTTSSPFKFFSLIKDMRSKSCSEIGQLLRKLADDFSSRIPIKKDFKVFFRAFKLKACIRSFGLDGVFSKAVLDTFFIA